MVQWLLQNVQVVISANQSNFLPLSEVLKKAILRRREEQQYSELVSLLINIKLKENDGTHSTFVKTMESKN